ncbi:MAG: hypothetical protein HDS82_04315 [Bacteroidales bacterium]|nr:hypothetical protein [Bacteroidales bacterium]
MKRLFNCFFALAFASVVMPASAENMFCVGSTWTVEYSGVDPDPFTSGPDLLSSTAVYYTEDNAGDEGKTLRLMERIDDSEPVLQTYLKTEGDKVWFKSNSETNEWTLMYDFGLQPGESCEVGIISYPFSETSTATLYTVTCEGIEQDSEYPTIERMKIKVSDKDGNLSDEGIWLKGVGSSTGVLTNVYFNMVGVNATLLTEATVNGKKVYGNTGSGIEEVETETSVSDRIYDLQGRELTAPVNGQPYIRGGKVMVETRR